MIRGPARLLRRARQRHDSPWPLTRVQNGSICAEQVGARPEARELVGLAATIGREFTFPVLASASDQGGDALVRSLDELWQRRIIREQGSTAYDFSHDKIREAAYKGLSAARRRLLTAG